MIVFPNDDDDDDDDGILKSEIYEVNCKNCRIIEDKNGIRYAVFFFILFI